MRTRRLARLSVVDHISLGLSGLRAHRTRAALSGLGIAIAIATMNVVVGIPASSQAALMRQLSGLGADMLQASPSADQDPPVRLPEKAVEMIKRIGPVTRASAVANTHTLVRRNDRTDPSDGSGLTVLATQLDVLPVIKAKVRDGRWLSTATARFPAVVLGSVAAVRLGLSDLPPGEHDVRVIIGDQWFTVIGILATTPLSPDVDRSVLVGWEAARSYLRFDGRPTQIFIESRESAVETVRAVLPATVYPEKPGMVRVTRPSDVLIAKRATESTFSSLFLALAAVALLVGGIGVANTMIISVLERRSEIGLRRALGARRGQIRTQFILESIALGAVGGACGAALGVAATVAYAVHHQWPIVVPLMSTLAGVGGAVLVGAIAGIYPAIRAARLSPTTALAAS